MSTTFASLRKNWSAAVGLLLALALLAGNFANGAGANNDTKPANKLAVAGSGDPVAANGEEGPVTLLTTTMKNPGSKALVISVTLECSILTDLLTAGVNDFSRAQAKALVWVEVNGEAVAYAGDVADGKVTFCEREYQRETRDFPADCEPEEEGQPDGCVIDDFIRTKASHGFNWVALHDGPGDKVIEVKAELTREATTNATATLVIGARTLIVEPADVARNETLSN